MSCAFAAGEIEFPNIIKNRNEIRERIRKYLVHATEDPQVTVVGDPSDCLVPSARIVSWGSDAERPALRLGRLRTYAISLSRLIHAINRADTAHPRPLLQRSVEHPKIVEITNGAEGVVTLSTKEPKIALTVPPSETYNTCLDAGWSSLVARWAHNSKKASWSFLTLLPFQRHTSSY